jgi:Serine carboxypeptidase
MFYFFFESRGKNSDPVVIWLTGGPGCSSELALFYENGPFKIADNLSLVWNDYGWDKVCIFPVGIRAVFHSLGQLILRKFCKDHQLLVPIYILKKLSQKVSLFMFLTARL